VASGFIAVTAPVCIPEPQPAVGVDVVREEERGAARETRVVGRETAIDKQRARRAMIDSGVTHESVMSRPTTTRGTHRPPSYTDRHESVTRESSEQELNTADQIDNYFISESDCQES